ncbi:MAG: tRNA lysidine(34) synthetase TilS [Phycisphaerae bacterium]|nr:tRNA lysidine(34) synthetase TilS [Phycisphaerae bacterium]
MAQQTFLKQLRSEIIDHGLIDPGRPVVLAVSGGPDSMAMLHGLVELNQVDEMGWVLHVAHLNHQIRGREADDDADFVARQAKVLALGCTVEREDIPALASQTKRSIEETARTRRYEFLEKVCLRVDAQIVATAHQADDNAETVLHHILRGTGLRGLAGISRSRPIRPGSPIRLIRPMLGLRRAELVDYLDEMGLAYRHDRSNESDEHTRNRLRNRVIPLLREQVNPQVTDALLRLAEQAEWFEHYLEATAARTFETLIVTQTDQELVLNAETLLKKSPIIQTELIRRAIMTLWAAPAYRGIEIDRELSFHHLQSVARLAANPGSGKQLSLPAGMTVLRQYRRLIFRLPGEELREEIAREIVVACPGRTPLPVRGLDVTTEIVAFDQEAWPAIQKQKDASEEWLDLDQIRPPLVVRLPKRGDRFHPLGAPGSKKLSDFFIDAKVPPDERDRAAVLCDQIGPIWIVGLRIDDRVRIRRSTRQALRIRAAPR